MAIAIAFCCTLNKTAQRTKRTELPTKQMSISASDTQNSSPSTSTTPCSSLEDAISSEGTPPLSITPVSANSPSTEQPLTPAPTPVTTQHKKPSVPRLPFAGTLRHLSPIAKEGNSYSFTLRLHRRSSSHSAPQPNTSPPPEHSNCDISLDSYFKRREIPAEAKEARKIEEKEIETDSTKESSSPTKSDFKKHHRRIQSAPDDESPTHKKHHSHSSHTTSISAISSAALNSPRRPLPEVPPVPEKLDLDFSSSWAANLDSDQREELKTKMEKRMNVAFEVATTEHTYVKQLQCMIAVLVLYNANVNAPTALC